MYVDDIRNAPDKSWKLVRTITDAINAIDIFNFDVISLDHDISHQFSADSRILINPDIKSKEPGYLCPETFLPVAVFIKEKYKDEVVEELPRIILHTANPAGALRMKGFLDRFQVEIKESVPTHVNE